MQNNARHLLMFFLFALLISSSILPVPLAADVELYYDDGAAENGYAPTSSLYTYAVRFHPPTSNTYQLVRVKYYIYGSPASFTVDIRDRLAQPLHSASATPTGTGWFVVELASQGVFVQGDFWVGIKYKSLNAPKLGADTTNPNGESAESSSGFPTSPNISSLDWMIRVTIRPYYPLYLRSRQDISSTETNLGQIKLDGSPYTLPKDFSAEAGGYSVEYVPASGYSFVKWETTGGITVSSSTANPTSMTVSSPGGTLRAVYKGGYSQLIAEFMPYWRFSKNEKYYPSSFYFDNDIDVENNADNFESWSLNDGFVYVHVAENGNYLTIQYWLYYVYNDHLPYHYNDWDSTVFVILNKMDNFEPDRVRLYRHWWPKTFSWDDPNLRKTGNHIEVYIAEGSHAAYISPEEMHDEFFEGIVNDNWNPGGITLGPENIPNWVYIGDTSNHDHHTFRVSLIFFREFCNIDYEDLKGNHPIPPDAQWNGDVWWPRDFNCPMTVWDYPAPWHRAEDWNPEFEKPLAPNGVQDMATYKSRISESGLLIEDSNLQMWVPRRYGEHSYIIFQYLKNGYSVLQELFGGHNMPMKFSIEHYPEGSTYVWGGTDGMGTIRYGYANLEDDTPEWNQYQVPHVIGYYEEMAHCFTMDFGLRDDHGNVGFYETLGLMIGGETALRAASNPYTESSIDSSYQTCAETTAYYLDHNTGPPGVTQNIYLTRILTHIFKKEFVTPYGWQVLTEAFSLIIQDGYPLGRIADQKCATDHTWGSFLYYLGKASNLQSSVHLKFKEYGLPFLTWTSDPGFESDGCEQVGENQYCFRVKILDREGTKPQEVRLHLYRGGSAESAYEMSLVGGGFQNGWIYELNMSISNPRQYSYTFSANDGVHIVFEAVGEPTERPMRLKAGLISDLDGNGIVNIIDISIVARLFGCRIGDGKWNPVVDLNNDGIINIIDISIVARDFGKTE